MKSIRGALVFVLLVALAACGAAKLKSEGEALKPITEAKAAAVGKIHALTLEQINIERNADGAYVRCFAKDGTIFLYIPAAMNGAVANLERSRKYIYRFKVSKNDYGPEGQLLEIAETNGAAVPGQLKGAGPGAKMVVLDGPAAVGKERTLDLVLRRVEKADEKEKTKATLHFNDETPYSTEVQVLFAKEFADQVKDLKEGDKFSVKLRVDSVDWRVFGTLVSLQKK